MIQQELEKENPEGQIFEELENKINNLNLD
jgi:hypothetical protein